MFGVYYVVYFCVDLGIGVDVKQYCWMFFYFYFVYWGVGEDFVEGVYVFDYCFVEFLFGCLLYYFVYECEVVVVGYLEGNFVLDVGEYVL